MSDMSVLSNISNLSSAFTLEKRFEKGFEVLSTLGKGGFAKVYKAKNILDDVEYAIKKITIKLQNKSPAQLNGEIAAVISEIRNLASSRNDCIVKYYQSWIEVELKEVTINFFNN